MSKKILMHNCNAQHHWPKLEKSKTHQGDFTVEYNLCNCCAAVKIVQRVLVWDKVSQITSYLTKETIIEPPGFAAVSGSATLPTEDDLSCPGCGCESGEGLTPGCSHPDGCGFQH